MARLNRCLSVAMCALSGFAATSVARAQEEAEVELSDTSPESGEPRHAAADNLSVSATVTLASEYRFRGVDLTDGGPALQGSLDVVHSSGLYAGA